MIRELMIGEYLKILALWKSAGLEWRDEGRDHPDKIKEQLEKGNIFFLGEITPNNELLGVILVTHDGRKGWINRLAVHPKHRHKGIAQKLLTVAEERLFQTEAIDVVSALISADNRPSLALFEKAGYESWSGIRYYSKRKRPDA